MPNFCSNDVHIDLKKDVDVKDFISKIGHFANDGSDRFQIDFEKIVPSNGLSECSNDWCIENWGTKWNVFDGRFDQYNRIEKMPHGHRIHLDLWTAWSPPEPIFQRLCEMDEVSFLRSDCFEEGVQFYGVYHWYNQRLDLSRFDRIDFWFHVKNYTLNEYYEQHEWLFEDDEESWLKEKEEIIKRMES